MIISLLGYMGSGKSHIAKTLSTKLQWERVDLDKEISKRCNLSIQDIFKQEGELYFRKKERETLEEILASKNNYILSLGGGTPVYYNNMEVINERSVSFFLQVSVNCLTERLSRNKEKRPLIARISDQDLPEFIAKHLFERNSFYSNAHFTINATYKTDIEICDEIIAAALSY